MVDLEKLMWLIILIGIILAIERYLRPKKSTIRIHWILGPVVQNTTAVHGNNTGFWPTRRGDSMSTFILQDDQKVHVGVAFKDAAGNDAKVDGAPVWASSDESTVLVTADADGMGAWVEAVGPLTTDDVQVSVSADADLGAGVENIVGVLGISVVGGKAVAAVMTPGIPVPKA